MYSVPVMGVQSQEKLSVRERTEAVYKSSQYQVEQSSEGAVRILGKSGKQTQRQRLEMERAVQSVLQQP